MEEGLNREVSIYKAAGEGLNIIAEEHLKAQKEAGGTPDNTADLTGKADECADKKFSGNNDPFMLNGAALAYIGDAVFELMVREYVLKGGSHQPDRLHKHTVAIVNAASQSVIAGKLAGYLTEEEQDIFKRGRNASTVTAPKNQNIADYRRATGLEALFGYLHLKGENERLEELFEIAVKERA